MKIQIQCDVCEKVEASVFCGADEAALCEGCDHRVHHANKLATKHQRFPLLHPSPSPSPSPSSKHHLPLCDICQEKRAFVFCREDRAILCRECDSQIHKANEHGQSHHRFLLTGVKISSTSPTDDTYPNSYSNSNSSSSNSSCEAANSNSKTNNPNTLSSKITSSSSTTDYSTMFLDEQDYGLSNADHMSGWRLEDLLPSSNNYAIQSSKTTLETMNNVNPHNQVEEESMGSFCRTQSHTQVDQYYSRMMWDFSPPSPTTCAFPSSFTDFNNDE